jgi:HSF-type DNA-binding
MKGSSTIDDRLACRGGAERIGEVGPGGDSDPATAARRSSSKQGRLETPTLDSPTTTSTPRSHQALGTEPFCDSPAVTDSADSSHEHPQNSSSSSVSSSGAKESHRLDGIDDAEVSSEEVAEYAEENSSLLTFPEQVSAQEHVSSHHLRASFPSQITFCFYSYSSCLFQFMLMVAYAEKKFNRNSQESSCSSRIPPVEWIKPTYDAIVFNDGEFFCQKIVPLFDIGRQATYSSFLRRLHRWGFRQFQYVETPSSASAGDCAPEMLPELLGGPESTVLADSIHSTGLVSATSSQSSARVAFRHSGFQKFRKHLLPSIQCSLGNRFSLKISSAPQNMGGFAHEAPGTTRSVDRNIRKRRSR